VRVRSGPCATWFIRFLTFRWPLFTQKRAGAVSRITPTLKNNTDHFVLLALAGGDIAGMVEIRRHRHVSLLFVSPGFQGKGVGGLLLEKAVELCRKTDPQLREMTVNSSPNALRAYERMGFAPTGGEQVICGVRFIPMKKVL
jgi:GNAT superfamily N-acetyltransferase